MPASTVRLVASPKNVGPKVTDTLNALQAACFVPSDRRVLEDSYWWIATSGKTPVGFAGLKPEGPDAGFLCLAGVVPAARGAGLHARLIRARLAFARKLGIKRVYTYTRVTNPVSTNHLVKAGFRAYVPQFAWAGNDVCYWQKGL